MQCQILRSLPIGAGKSGKLMHGWWLSDRFKADYKTQCVKLKVAFNAKPSKWVELSGADVARWRKDPKLSNNISEIANLADYHQELSKLKRVDKLNSESTLLC